MTRGSGNREPGHETASYWDRVADEWTAGRDDLWRRHSDNVNLALCRRWLPARVHRLLKTDAFDEASSTGLWPSLTDMADIVESIDQSPAVAIRARQHHPGLSATVADVRRLPFADESFDAVISNSTLDHFERVHSINEGVLEIRRVLAPGGLLLLTLDNPANPAVGLRNALPFAWLKRLGLVPYFVGATLGPADAARLLEDAGLEVVKVTSVLHCPRVLAVPAARLVSRLSRAPRAHAWFLRVLGHMEAAERWPTRFRTGHYVAVLARRPSAG